MWSENSSHGDEVAGRARKHRSGHMNEDRRLKEGCIGDMALVGRRKSSSWKCPTDIFLS